MAEAKMTGAQRYALSSLRGAELAQILLFFTNMTSDLSIKYRKL